MISLWMMMASQSPKLGAKSSQDTQMRECQIVFNKLMKYIKQWVFACILLVIKMITWSFNFKDWCKIANESVNTRIPSVFSSLFVLPQSPSGGPRNLWWRLWLCWLWNRCLWPGWGGGGRPGWRELGSSQEADKEEARKEEHLWALWAQWAGKQSHDWSRQWDPHYGHAREIPGMLVDLMLLWFTIFWYVRYNNTETKVGIWAKFYI